MQLNPDIAGTVRAPRFLVKIGPDLKRLQLVTGVIATEVSSSSRHATADTFYIHLATSELPPSASLAWLTSAATVYVAIYMGVPEDPQSFTAADLTQMITGRVDTVDYNPPEGTVSLVGRDLTGLLIDKKSSINFVNLSSSQIAERLAQKHGLTAIVTKTRIQAGKYYTLDSRLLFDQRSDWEVLQYLAQVENFIVYVSNTSLFFGPNPADSAAPYTYAPYVIRWTPPTGQSHYPSANVQSIELSREKTVSRGVEVIVMSWNPKTGTPTRISARP